jgi:hypothetical protein
LLPGLEEKSVMHSGKYSYIFTRVSKEHDHGKEE